MSNIEKYNYASRNGISIESNYCNFEALKQAVNKGVKDPYILFIKSFNNNDIYDVSPAYHQGYTLKETIELRDYLNNLIAATEPIIKETI